MDVRFNDCVMLGWIVGECWNGYVGLKRIEMLGFVGLEWFGECWIDWMEYVELNIWGMLEEVWWIEWVGYVWLNG